MKPSIVSALPPEAPTGWGVASRLITEALGHECMLTDARDVVRQNDYPTRLLSPVIQAMNGVNMTPMYPHIYSAIRNVGYNFIEDNILLEKYVMNARYWDAIACGSTWASEQMREAMGARVRRPVFTAIQGVDTDVFRPDPELNGYEKNWFTVWSAGKFEYRKGQDIVIAAMKVLMERHADVRLVAAWHNPWPQTVYSMFSSPYIAGDMTNVHTTAESLVWKIASAHLDMKRVSLLGEAPHGGYVADMNRCDVALFPNRCEAGTNLPLMEAMACALPVVATGETGHRDVIATDTPGKWFTYERAGMPVGKWFEPDLDALIEKLEFCYADWRERESLILTEQGNQNRASISEFTWKKCAESLLEACR